MFSRQHAGRESVRIIAVLAMFTLLAGVAGCGAIDSLTRSGPEASSTTTSMGVPSPGQDAVKGDSRTVTDAYGEAVPAATNDLAVNVPEADRLVIRNKALRIEVKGVTEALDQVKAAAKKHDGVITNMQVASNSGSPIYRSADSGGPTDGAPLLGYVTVRVPAAAFSAFVDDVSKIGNVKYEAETSDDVTQQHVDLQARLDNLRAEEKRLREFFTAAKNVNEMLAIDQELARVRGEIESLDAQAKYLERQAAMATVTIDLSEPQAIVRPSGQDWGFGEAVTTGFRGAAGAIQLLIVVTITLLPYLVIVAVLAIVVRAIVRARRRNRSAHVGDGAEPPVVDE